MGIRSELGKPLFLVLILLAIAVLSGCSGSARGDGLAFNDVRLVSEPEGPTANQPVKLIVKVDKAKYAKQDADVQLQINSNNSLPALIDTVKEGEDYAASYTFPAAGNYTITMHMSYEAEHYAYARPLKVGG